MVLTAADETHYLFVLFRPPQEEKLRRELALVKGNLTVMSEMLNELKPGQSKPDDTELLQVRVCVCQIKFLLQEFFPINT